MKKVGKFVFGGPINDGLERQKSPLIILENGAMYEGEWLKNKDIRDGRGI
jgi:hypothetical protein